MDLANKGWAVFGLRGSGKSWFVKSVLQSTRDHLIYDPLKEHQGYNKYTPTDRTDIEELSTLIQGLSLTPIHNRNRNQSRRLTP